MKVWVTRYNQNWAAEITGIPLADIQARYEEARRLKIICSIDTDKEVAPTEQAHHSDARAIVVTGRLGGDGDRVIIAPGAFKHQTDIPLRWGIGGKVIGKAELAEDGTIVMQFDKPKAAGD